MSSNLTVIISLHITDRADWFYEAAESVLNQSVQPDKMLITVDGQITDDHEQVIKQLVVSFPHIEIFRLNRTYNDRGAILGVAVESAQTKFVAIMDADDISKIDRFEKQLSKLNSISDLDVVGSWVEEISPSDADYLCIRKVPESPPDVMKYSKLRNPVNNMTVMFRRESIIKAGNYRSMLNFADYWLWVRLLGKGGQIANIQESLVTARAAEGLALRRRGVTYAISEFRFYQQCYNEGYVGMLTTIRCLLLRLPTRFLPAFVFNHVVFRHLRN